MSDIRLIPISAEERRQLGELIERIIARRDSTVYTELRDQLADDANLLASLASRYEGGIEQDEACNGAAAIDARAESWEDNRAVDVVLRSLATKLRSLFNPTSPEEEKS